MPSTTTPVWNTPPNHGVLVELFLVFQELEVQEPVDQAKVLSVTCVEKVECSLLLDFGEDGTEEQILNKEDMP